MTIELSRVGVAFEETTVVSDVSLVVETGGWVSLIGPNGAGKSSLLRAVAGLVEASGQISICDTVLSTNPNRRLVSRLVAYVPQRPVLPASMTVFDYALLGRSPHVSFLGTESQRDKEITATVLLRLGLAEMSARRLSSLSGGEAQRVVLARALAQEAPVLLLDEPTTGLDLGHQQQVLELVDELRSFDRLSVLSSMHDLVLAGQYADRLALISGGKLVALGPPHDVLTEELIEAHYSASVAVIEEGGSPAVLPRRKAPPPRRSGP